MSLTNRVHKHDKAANLDCATEWARRIAADAVTRMDYVEIYWALGRNAAENLPDGDSWTPKQLQVLQQRVCDALLSSWRNYQLSRLTDAAAKTAIRALQTEAYNKGITLNESEATTMLQRAVRG